MRRLILIVAAVASVALPSSAAADAITQVGFGQQWYGAGSLTLNATGSGPAFLFELIGLGDAQAPAGWTVTDASITFMSPELEAKHVDVASEVTTYDFAPGLLTIDLTLASNTTLQSVSGGFHAALPAFSFSVYDESGSNSDCPCSDPLQFLPFGGMLDESLANALGVSRHTIHGRLWLMSEQLEGAYGDVREGPAIGDVEFDVVPEPSSALLFVAASAGLLLRRRRRR
jgi:hypothetical protein